jgi:hypothetical protein
MSLITIAIKLANNFCEIIHQLLNISFGSWLQFFVINFSYTKQQSNRFLGVKVQIILTLLKSFLVSFNRTLWAWHIKALYKGCAK